VVNEIRTGFLNHLELKTTNTAIVIVAEAHNPTILHPAFLRAEEIIPNEWELAAEPPVSTPAISIVRFANQISFLVDTNKIQIADAGTGNERSIADVAVRYVRKLPYVHYSAVGININGYAECNAPEGWLLDRFLKQGSWTRLEDGIKAAGFKLVYEVANAQLNVTLDVGSVQGSETAEKPCITVNGNYHTAIKPERAVEKTAAAISAYVERITHFRTIIDAILNG
jgi:hypothetical protein